VDQYWSIRTNDGAPARIALYFPQTAAMEELKPVVESALAIKGIDQPTLLDVHSQSSEETKWAFYRVANDPDSPHRVILLVNMGTEGWNCPSLFATALIRKLKSSNNFVLQAATRCLRQVPGNTRPARIYLTMVNRKVLEKQLQETYGTSIQELDGDQSERVNKDVVLRKWSMPPVLLKKKVLRYRRKQESGDRETAIRLDRPDIAYQPAGTMQTWMLADPESGNAHLTRSSLQTKRWSPNPGLSICTPPPRCWRPITT